MQVSHQLDPGDKSPPLRGQGVFGEHHKNVLGAAPSSITQEISKPPHSLLPQLGKK